MHSLWRNGHVTLFQNDIGRIIDTSFIKLITSCYSHAVKRDKLDRDTWNALNANDPHRNALLKPTPARRKVISVRTALLIISVLVSLADIAALFALSTEGKNVADKPEFGVRTQLANYVPPDARMLFYNPHEAQIRYEYVIRRLQRRMAFNNGSQFQIAVPRRLDPVQDEKWPFTVALAEEDKYATVFTRDFISEERANFSERSGQVSGSTESGMLLSHYEMARRDRDRNVCAGSMSGIATTGVNGTATFCYTDQLRNMSCLNMTDNESVAFSMKCSEIRVERFGDNIYFDNDTIWWMNRLAGKDVGRRGEASLMQMNSLRAYKIDDVSPSAMVVAAVLTEFPSQIVLERRPFFVDVSVVIVPNWLIASSMAVSLLILLLSVSASVYARLKNLVVLNDWQELLISNLLEPLDCLNRAHKREFRCVVGKADEYSEKKYRFYVEPGPAVVPMNLVKRQDVG
ncbi:hypothetical protein FGB62_186g022 [Gracilaria domingensis]|nr:hypothetical protein FGB62_186g022 [Gracilaria domingensis]